MSLDFDSARLPNPHLREEHHQWRAQLRKFIDSEIMPHAAEWDEADYYVGPDEGFIASDDVAAIPEEAPTFAHAEN